MENEIKRNVNIYFNGIFDYIRDKDSEISFLHHKIKLNEKEIERLKEELNTLKISEEEWLDETLSGDKNE